MNLVITEPVVGTLISLPIEQSSQHEECLRAVVATMKPVTIKAGGNDCWVVVAGFQFFSRPGRYNIRQFSGYFQGPTSEKVPTEPGAPFVILMDHKGGGTLNFVCSISPQDL
ncbi:MAG: hypothetical protein AAB787_02540 [Patescibacteria group bacterium]